MAVHALNTEQPLLQIGNLLELKSGLVTFMPGSRIFEQGEMGDLAYMIDSGYVEVAVDVGGKKNSLATLGPGEIFGEMALIDGLPRSATAIALHETTVISISRKQLLDAVNAGNPILRLVLIASINRLRAAQTTSVPAHQCPDLQVDRDFGFAPQYETARVNAAEQVRLRFELENAIAMREFELAYQPILSLVDGRTAGFEALIRWPQPGSRTRSPLEFIPLAESTGLIVPLGRWVLERGLAALAHIERSHGGRNRDHSPAFISINVSPRQLDTEEHVEQLATLIEQTDINPANVKLEITEQTLLDDPKMAMIGLARLKATGVSIAIDDFGTGYSSLNYLHRFPLDTLKLDRSFVTKVTHDTAAQRVVKAIIDLAHDLEMDVVAEGIEEIEELRWLQSHSCRYGQGYLTAKPSTFEEAMKHLNRNFEW